MINIFFWIKNIVKGEFLVKKNASKNWKFILFLILLGLISITSSHIVDNKISKINKLYENIQEAKSQYEIVHMKIIKIQLESNLEKLLIHKGLKPLKEPPYELIINKK